MKLTNEQIIIANHQLPKLSVILAPYISLDELISVSELQIEMKKAAEKITVTSDNLKGETLKKLTTVSQQQVSDLAREFKEEKKVDPTPQQLEYLLKCRWKDYADFIELQQQFNVKDHELVQKASDLEIKKQLKRNNIKVPAAEKSDFNKAIASLMETFILITQ